MASSHPAQPAASRAAGAGDSAGSTGPDEVQALLIDIFTLTGQKVQKDDPLVAAALIHSALLRRAGDDAAQTIAQAAQSERQRALRWPGPWHTQVMLGASLFVICFVASALGTLLASSCR